MSFVYLYAPTSQKQLFNKDIVSHIRKWIVALQQNPKKILLLSGPTGCGKSATIDVLCKQYNLLKLDGFEMRSPKKCEEALETINNYNTISLDRETKGNILLLDNVTSIDGVEEFLKKVCSSKTIPIICLCSSSNICELQKCGIAKMWNNYVVTSLQFPHPSLLELNKLGMEIVEKENLGLDKSKLKQIIEFCQKDIRQFLTILYHWKLHPKGSLQKFLDSLQMRNNDVDLNSKLCIILNSKDNFDFTTSILSCSSEPVLISNHIYQNYISTTDDIYSICDIIDSISLSNTIHKSIFEGQSWELYEDYTITSCVIPEFIISQERQSRKTDKGIDIMPYKDISSNYLNSLKEIKDSCAQNFANPHLRKLLGNYGSTQLLHRLHTTNSFQIADIILCCINNVGIYYQTNKKGKNTTKREKMFLYSQLLANETVVKDLRMIVDIVTSYRMFEVDIDFILLNYKVSSDIGDLTDKFYDYIDIKLLKRFLNIFSLNTHNVIKSNVEAAIKYGLLYHLLETISKQPNDFNVKKDISDFMVDIADIWKL